jgi:DNA-binding LacI/PurR family transcriptional regulator
MSKQLSSPSAHDVARLAGVSQAAVSRAFTPGASIAKGTQERIFDAAKLLGYRPNLLARSLIKGESGIIGVIIGNPRSLFFMSALHALSARLSQAGKHILVAVLEGRATADAHVDDLLSYRVDAVSDGNKPLEQARQAMPREGNQSRLSQSALARDQGLQ